MINILLTSQVNSNDVSTPHKKSALNFFLIVYGLSLPLWLLQLFIGDSSLPLNIPITDIVAAFTPLFAACILTYKIEGKQGVQQLLVRIVDVKKIKPIWWFIIIGLPVLIFSLIYFSLKIAHYELPEQWTISYYSLPVLLVFFFLGAIGEEVGYMGYAVDPLQEKYSAFWTGIIIGIPWMVWHYPSILHQGHSFYWILWGTLGTVAFRVLYVWIFNNTCHSLFACILPHCLYNTGRVLFPIDKTVNPLSEYPEIHYSVIAVIAIIVTFLWSPATLNNFLFKSRTTRR